MKIQKYKRKFIKCMIKKRNEGDIDMATISFERDIGLNKKAALKLLHELERTDKIVYLEDTDIEKELEEGRRKLKEIFKQ